MEIKITILWNKATNREFVIEGNEPLQLEDIVEINDQPCKCVEIKLVDGCKIVHVKPVKDFSE